MQKKNFCHKLRLCTTEDVMVGNFKIRSITIFGSISSLPMAAVLLPLSETMKQNLVTYLL
jgi:hypothetical protein